MSYLDWHVGMKVVCVDGSNRYASNIVLPKAGTVYTIRKIVASWPHWLTAKPKPAIWLEEIVRPVGLHGVEHPYGADRFRPVQTKKTDISIFTVMLDPSKVRA